MERDRLGRARVDVRACPVERGVHGVRLGRAREVDGRLRERQLALGRSEEVVGVLGRQRDRERLGIGQPDVLRRHADEPPRDEEPVLARLEHPGQPVERRVGIRVAHGLVERADQVVVLLARLVVEERLLLRRLADRLDGEARRRAALAAGGAEEPRGDLQDVQRGAGVALRQRHDRRHGVGIQLETEAAQAAVGVRHRPADDRLEIRLGQPLQHVDAAAREQRRDHLERRVLGGRADQGHGAALDVRQERVLLRLVEAVDLVDEEDRALAAAA